MRYTIYNWKITFIGCQNERQTRVWIVISATRFNRPSLISRFGRQQAASHGSSATGGKTIYVVWKQSGDEIFTPFVLISVTSITVLRLRFRRSTLTTCAFVTVTVALPPRVNDCLFKNGKQTCAKHYRLKISFERRWKRVEKKGKTVEIVFNENLVSM